MTNSGMQITSFSVAVNERVKKGEEWQDRANYVDCVMFGRRAEVLAEKLCKGSKVCVKGKLHYSSWQTQDGSRRSKLEVNVDEIELLSAAQQVSNDIYDEELPF